MSEAISEPNQPRRRGRPKGYKVPPPEPIVLGPSRVGGRKLTTAPVGTPKKTPGGKYRGHRKDGTFTKFRGQRRACTVEGCSTKQLARGYCRKHYERDRKHGDPTLVVRNSPKFTPAALDAAGITPRRRNHWVDQGLIAGKRHPDTRRFLWTVDATRQALLIHRLSNMGIPLPMAGLVAHAVVKDGLDRVLVGPGVWLLLEDDTAEVSAL